MTFTDKYKLTPQQSLFLAKKKWDENVYCGMKMENRNYREEIGKAIEEALELEDFDELEDLIEMPSPETFAKWVDMGQEKYEKRVRRKRLLTACAAVLVLLRIGKLFLLPFCRILSYNGDRHKKTERMIPNGKRKEGAFSPGATQEKAS